MTAELYRLAQIVVEAARAINDGQSPVTLVAETRHRKAVRTFDCAVGQYVREQNDPAVRRAGVTEAALNGWPLPRRDHLV